MIEMSRLGGPAIHRVKWLDPGFGPADKTGLALVKRYAEMEAEQPVGSAPAADWWRGAVIYQIYPRSFADSDGDGVGDLPGILGKLDYVASLGVDGIWLSPFFRSPMKDFGYDVSDYTDVDPLFGTLADFEAVIARAHALGLKVIIDQVWSHTSNEHAWFLESASSRDNSKADWYVWADAKPDGSPPNNWLASFGGASWTWGPRRRQYYLHNFLTEQPDLNFWSLSVQEAILEAARFWLDRGVDGFRLDVINYIFHDAALSDNPVEAYGHSPPVPTQFQRHQFDRSRPEALTFLRRLRALMDSYAERMTVGEIVDYDQLARQREYTTPPDRLHTAYSFYLLTATKATPQLFTSAMDAWSDAAGWPSWSLGNHDVARFASRMARSGSSLQVRILLAVLVALRGTIFLYQGEELGLPDAKVPFEALRDPFAITSYTGGSGRDGARTPMPWTSDGPAAGFSTTSDTWLPIDPAHRPIAVAEQEHDPASVLQFTRSLIALRKSHPALRWGDAKVLEAPEGVFVLERATPEETIVCMFELSGIEVCLPLSADFEIIARFSGGEKVVEQVAIIPAFGGLLLRSIS
jgi:alpha-glucosidase